MTPSFTENRQSQDKNLLSFIRAAVGMGIPMGIPTGMGMGWVWGLKFNPHGSPDETVK